MASEATRSGRKAPARSAASPAALSAPAGAQPQAPVASAASTSPASPSSASSSSTSPSPDSPSGGTSPALPLTAPPVAVARSGAAIARRGLLVIISSPSGAGKSTLARRLMAWDPALGFSVSATTRAPRPGEREGREYLFRSRAEFEAMVARGEMLEHAEVFGNLYGSPRAPVEAAMAAGRDTLFDVDWQGGQQIRRSPLGQDAVSVFILPPSMAVLESRLSARGADSPAVIAARMARSRDEISHWSEYDYVLVNDDIDRATAALCTIVAAERLRAERQQGLTEFVRGLNKEFADR